MKYGECEKCKRQTYLHKHHVLPKTTFGENDSVRYLCPTCHTEYHQALGKEIKNPDMKFHFYFFDKWFYGLLGISLFALAYVCYWYFKTIFSS